MIDLNVGIALVTAMGTAVATIFYSGRQVGKVGAAVDRIYKFEQDLKEALRDVPLLRTDVEILQNLYERAHSDFRQLQTQFVQDQKERIEIRIKMASQHEE